MDAINPVMSVKKKSKGFKFLIVCLILLAVGIAIAAIGAALGGIRPISIGPGGFHVYSLEDLREVTTINKTFHNVKNIELNVAVFTTVEFVEGDGFSVKGQNQKMHGQLLAKEKDGTLEIYTEDRTRSKWGGFTLTPWINFDGNTSHITITYPKGVKLENVRIDTDVVSDLSLNNLTCKSLELTTSVSDVKMNTIDADEMTIRMNTGDIHADRVSAGAIDIESSIGEVSFSRTNVQSLSTNVNTGDFEFSGKILGDSYLDVDIGDIDMELDQSEDMLGLILNVSVGDVRINGQEVGSKYHRSVASSAKNLQTANLTIDANVSEVRIKFLG
jgi:hypothetical protein